MLQMMSVLGSYVQFIEAERSKQTAQIETMWQENAWLRDELASTHQRLQLSEQRCATLDEEKSHLQFLSDLKTCEAGSVETAEVRCGEALRINLTYIIKLYMKCSLYQYLCFEQSMLYLCKR